MTLDRRCPRSSTRGVRSARSRPSRSPGELLDTLVEAACIAPAPHHSRPWRFVVVDGRRRQGAISRAGMGARWRADLDARRRRPRRASTSSSSASHAKLARRARARARLPHLGRARPLPRRASASAPSGAWRCCRSAPRSRTSCSPPPTAGSRRAGSRRRSSARKPRATRWRCPEAWLPHALVMVGHPDPGYAGRAAPAGPARRPPHLPPLIAC